MKSIFGHIIFLCSIFNFIVLLESCNSTDPKKKENKPEITFKLIKYPSGATKEKHEFRDGVLTTISYLDEDGYIDSSKKFDQGKVFSFIRYIYREDKTVEINVYINDRLISTLISDSLQHLLYESPFYIPKIIHTTYKFRSGRTYFDHNKVDTIEIINNDIPPFNKGYIFNGVNSIRVNSFGVFKIQKFYQKKKTPDSLKIWLTVCQDISIKNQIRVKIDSIMIPVK